MAERFSNGDRWPQKAGAVLGVVAVIWALVATDEKSRPPASGSRISETRYEIEQSSRQRDFSVDAGQEKRLVFHAGEYPELIAWFNERAPLGYEWIPVKSVGERRVLDKTGDYARVPRE